MTEDDAFDWLEDDEVCVCEDVKQFVYMCACMWTVSRDLARVQSVLSIFM